MGYKWKPNASQRRAFAAKMNNPDERAQYEADKKVREDKRRAGSQYDYHTAGGSYIPTQAQYEFAISYGGELTPEQRNAFNMVISGYIMQDKVHHDYIHVVNELLRSHSINQV